jgi:hypothetical protein
MVARSRPRRSSLRKAKVLARKPVDRAQNAAVSALAKRIKKLEHVTVERKYLTMTDAFQFGGAGQVRSRQLHRYNTGTYDGMTTSALFGTTTYQGDMVFAKYMLVDVEIQCHNPTVLEDEISPTTFQIFLLKSRKQNDLTTGPLTWAQSDSLNDSDVISQNAAGQSFVNPKGWKVIKSRHGVIGGVNATAGFGVAHRRYRFKIPINRRVLLQDPTAADTNTMNYPMSVQDWYWFAITANGSSLDGAEPHCSISTMLCYDDAGAN